jgi:hypothetical protein
VSVASACRMYSVVCIYLVSCVWTVRGEILERGGRAVRLAGACIIRLFSAAAATTVRVLSVSTVRH